MRLGRRITIFWRKWTIRFAFQFANVFRFVWLLSFVCSCYAISNAQPQKVKKGSSLRYLDTTIIVQHDTLIPSNDSSLLKIKSGFLTRSFNNWFVASKHFEDVVIQAPLGSKLNAWYTNKKVRSIRIKSLEVFGTSIHDTAYYQVTGIGSLANKIHINTLDMVIRRNLLFLEGEEINSLLVEESERLLRALPYIKDARIYIVPVDNHPEQIDVLVFEKDIWSIDLDFRFPDVDQTILTITESNLVGLGHELANRFHIDLNEPLKYRLQYVMPNILGSFTRGTFIIGKTQDFDEIKVSLSRNFITPDIKYGGGFEFNDYDGFDILYPSQDSIHISLSTKTTQAWVGRSFQLRSNPQKGSLNLISSLGILYTRYANITHPDYQNNPEYQNSTHYIGSLTLSKRRFFKSNYLFGFGKTEDVPQGFRLEGTAGYEQGSIYDRWYGGLSLTHSSFLAKWGYLSSRLEMGSYYANGISEQGAIQFNSLYFTRLLGENKPYRHRFIVDINLIHGLRRRDNEIIRIDDKFGIRGLKTEALKGHSKFTVHLSHLVFTPWKPLGFQIAFAAFGDFGFVSREKEALFSNRAYSGFGIEMQFNNEDLVFGVLKVRFAFYPSPPADAPFFRISGGSDPDRLFDDLGGKLPSIFAYGNEYSDP